MAKKNSGVYVTGLPGDATVAELVAYCSRCGIIMDEVSTGQPRVRLYADAAGRLKGDALVVYLRPESVALAVQLLDDGELRAGVRVRVQEAQQQPGDAQQQPGEDAPGPGEGDAAARKRAKVDARTWKKHMQRMNKRLEWFDADAEEARRRAALAARHASIVLLAGMYTAADVARARESLAGEDQFWAELSVEIAEECAACLGLPDASHVSVRPVPGREADGLVSVKFRDPLLAEGCRRLLHGRCFDGRLVVASIYDGSFPLTAPRPVPLDADVTDAARLEQFSRFIEGEEDEDREDDDDEDDEEDENEEDEDDEEDENEEDDENGNDKDDQIDQSNRNNQNSQMYDSQERNGDSNHCSSDGSDTLSVGK